MKHSKNSRWRERWACTGIVVLLAMPASAADVDVTVTGVAPTTGRIMCRVFTENSGFPIRGALQTAYGGLEFGVSRCKFAGLPDGRYAIAVLHDANDNGRLDKSFIGLPAEGLAFSQNVRPMIGVPSFSSAAFKVGPEGARLSLRMIYP